MASKPNQTHSLPLTCPNTFTASRAANVLSKKNRRLLECVTSNKSITKKCINVRLCLERGADVNTADGDRNTVLHLAVRREKPILVELLLNHGANVNARDMYNNTPLHLAASCRTTIIAELLMKKGADTNARSTNGETPLHAAAQSDDLCLVELLLNKGADVNAQTKRGFSPLHLAAQLGRTSTAQLLLNKGADVYMEDMYGTTTLHEAASSGDTSIVELLLNKGIDVNAKDKYDYTPLHIAARSGETPVVELLLNESADVNAQARNGDTPLHEAALSGEVSLVELLLNKGAKVNPHIGNGVTPLQKVLDSGEISVVERLLNIRFIINQHTVIGDTPLHRAFRSGEMHIAELLLNKGADVNAQTIKGVTPLHEAARFGNTSILELLLHKGAKVNVQTTDGHTPLHIAAYWGNKSIVDQLLINDATVNARDAIGKTPLHEAASSGSGNIPVIKLLLNKGADVNAMTINGDTPLHLVVAEHGVQSSMFQYFNEINITNEQAREGTMETLPGEMSVKLLLNRGAKVNLQTTKGYTPLHLAVQNGQTSLVEMQLNKDADVNARTTTGNTPLHLAVQYGQVVIAEMLLNKGADVNLQNKFKNTPLHEAAQSRRSQQTFIVKLLLSRNVDVNVRNNEEKTPLYVAAETGSTAVLKQLSRVADVAAQAANGDTPLHGATRFGNICTLKLLLNLNADINAQNTNGETPLHVAVRHEHVAVTTLLVHRGANVMLRTKAGNTPLGYAMFFSVDENIVRLLQTAEKEAGDNDQINGYRHQASRNLSLITLGNEFKYVKTPETSGLLGQLYETKLVSLILIRALNHAEIEQDFLLGANVDGIGAMDDICLRYRVTGHRPVVLFIQAKHKEDPKKGKISDEALWRDSEDFSLRKYFESYLMIKERFQVGNEDRMFEGEFRNVDCYFILYTSAKECLTKKKTKNKLNEIVHNLINTGKTEPFQLKYDKADVDRLIEVAVTLRTKNSENLKNQNTMENYTKQVKDFFNRLWFYPGQDKQDGVEFKVKHEIDKHYNNKKDANHIEFNEQSQAIFLKAHYEVQKWWIERGNISYLSRFNDYFGLAKLAFLDNSFVTCFKAMDYFQLSVDLKFSQRFYMSNFSYRNHEVFITALYRLIETIGTTNKFICIGIDSYNSIVKLMMTDDTLSDKYAASSCDQLQTLSNFLEINNLAISRQPCSDCSLFSRRAGTSEVGGVLFRTKMLTLVFLRSLNHAQIEIIEQYSLMENKIQSISAMSDIYLRYRVKGQERPIVLFAQLVHREDPEKGILYNEALWSTSGDFSLLKYFKSYLIIKEQFQVDNEDPMFKGEFGDVDCYFVLYTTAKGNLTKKTTENKLNKVSLDLLSTRHNTEPFQYDYDDTDIDRLSKETVLYQIDKLGTVFLELNLPDKFNPNVLSSKLIARYHVALCREVLEPCEIQPANKEYRLWQFCPEFFNSELEHLVTLKESFFKTLTLKRDHRKKISNYCKKYVTRDDDQEKLKSRKFKLPLAFGNLDMSIRGDETKVLKRVKVLADKLMDLLELNKEAKIVVINDGDVGPGKTIEQGIINMNGGIGSAVGNLLVFDIDSNMLKFDVENEALPHNAALLLKELKDNRHKPFNDYLSAYRIKINVDGFPKDSFNRDNYYKMQAKYFLSKLWFYPDQAKEDEVERIFNEEIYIKYDNRIFCQNHSTSKNISNTTALYSLDEIQKWWMQTSESPYLSRASELFERAELADILNLLQTVINFMYVTNIYIISINVNQINQYQDKTKQISELFNKIVVKLFTSADPKFKHLDLNRYNFSDVEESTLCLKIHPKMEWVALTMTRMKKPKSFSNSSNANIKYCFVAKAPGPDQWSSRGRDKFMLCALNLCGSLYRFTDCLNNTSTELIIRR